MTWAFVLVIIIIRSSNSNIREAQELLVLSSSVRATSWLGKSLLQKSILAANAFLSGLLQWTYHHLCSLLSQKLIRALQAR